MFIQCSFELVRKSVKHGYPCSDLKKKMRRHNWRSLNKPNANVCKQTMDFKQKKNKINKIVIENCLHTSSSSLLIICWINLRLLNGAEANQLENLFDSVGFAWYFYSDFTHTSFFFAKWEKKKINRLRIHTIP